MNKSKFSILFLGKKNDEFTNRALNFCRDNFDNVTYYLANWGDPLPEDIGYWEGEYIISYLSRWIIPEYLLKKAKKAAINFHPAPPEYPGYGPNNFALYEDSKEFGVTCHYMAPNVDAGQIIDIKRFPIFETDSIDTLLLRTYSHQIVLFYEIMGFIIANKQLPISKEIWKRKPYSKKELNELYKIDKDMDLKEISKRVRATDFGKWKPYIDLYGFIFELKDKHDSNL